MPLGGQRGRNLPNQGKDNALTPAGTCPIGSFGPVTVEGGRGSDGLRPHAIVHATSKYINQRWVAAIYERHHPRRQLTDGIFHSPHPPLSFPLPSLETGHALDESWPGQLPQHLITPMWKSLF